MRLGQSAQKTFDRSEEQRPKSSTMQSDRRPRTTSSLCFESLLKVFAFDRERYSSEQSLNKIRRGHKDPAYLLFTLQPKP